jgi:uncharacterized repeat protein (TIGR03803 family)
MKPPCCYRRCSLWVVPAIWLAVSSCLPAQTFTTLSNFFGSPTNGSNPVAPMVQGVNGDFYGTTLQGGPSCFDYGSSGCGTIFKITPEGTLTTLYYFCSLANCADGSGPNGLVLGPGGSLYGTTRNGGAASGAGTIFRLTPAGVLTTIYTFCTSDTCTDGSIPSGLFLGANGNYYGTTNGGGMNSQGSVFKVTSAGALTTLYSFCTLTDCVDGQGPRAGVVQGSGGNLYGTTQYGGLYGWGSVFEISPAGSFTNLYSFCKSGQDTGNCPDGSHPLTALTVAPDADLYGTTYSGGSDNTCSLGCGTVFQITPAGSLTTLHSFTLADGDGANPFSRLVRGSNGGFYGTTIGGGAHSEGTIFGMTPAGALTTIESFDGTDGANGEGLVQSTSGTFFGTTDLGGTAFYGTVFKLALGLREFLELLPVDGTAGASVKILGTNLTGSTGVEFNGTAATFTVVSASEITATVPVGATSGLVEVTTPGGTISSIVSFLVVP